MATLICLLSFRIIFFFIMSLSLELDSPILISLFLLKVTTNAMYYFQCLFENFYIQRVISGAVSRGDLVCTFKILF